MSRETAMFGGILNAENYKQMRTKICLWVFAALLIQVMLIDRSKCDLKSILRIFSDITFDIPIAGSISLSIIIFPFIAAVLSYVIILHDKISDIFRIRRYFDFKYIFSPMVMSLLSIAPNQKSEIFYLNRREVMRNIFYKYASSADDSLVSNHNIHEALDNWSSFWICLETIAFSLLILLYTIFLCYPRDALVPVIAILLCSVGAPIFWRRAKSLIEPQISQILENGNARQEIENTLKKYLQI